MGQLSKGSGLSGNAVRVIAALFKTLMSESSFGSVCSHLVTVGGFGFGNLKNVHCHTDRASWDAILVDSCRFWSPHVEKMCAVTQIRLGESGGGGGTIGGGQRTENRDHIP